MSDTPIPADTPKFLKRIALLGAGEIGSAIKKIAQAAGYKVLVRELKYDEFDGRPVEALHVCIPQKDDKFTDYVKEAARDSKPRVVIIHSSTAPGTTNRVYKKIKIPTAHSPVRGEHPDLYPSIKDVFVKYVGGVNEESAELAMKHLKKLGIKKVKNGGSAINTELGKMFNILGFVWSIVFTKWAKRASDDLGADFEIAYTDFMKTYNEGYEKLKPNVRQSVLRPVKGPIGGHCVIPDTQLVHKVYPNELTKFILKKNEDYKKEK